MLTNATGSHSRTPCTLNAFLSDYIKDTFIRRQHAKLGAKVETATKCQEAWKVPITPEQATELALPRPLLQVSVNIQSSPLQRRSVSCSTVISSENTTQTYIQRFNNLVTFCSIFIITVTKPLGFNSVQKRR